MAIMTTLATLLSPIIAKITAEHPKHATETILGTPIERAKNPGVIRPMIPAALSMTNWGRVESTSI